MYDPTDDAGRGHHETYRDTAKPAEPMTDDSFERLGAIFRILQAAVEPTNLTIAMAWARDMIAAANKVPAEAFAACVLQSVCVAGVAFVQTLEKYFVKGE